MGIKVQLPRPRANTGSKTVGATAVQLSTSERRLVEGVTVVADAGNAGSVYVGNRPNVTAGSNADTDGVKLVAGASITFPCDTESEIYIIATSASNTVTFLSL